MSGAITSPPSTLAGETTWEMGRKESSKPNCSSVFFLSSTDSPIATPNIPTTNKTNNLAIASTPPTQQQQQQQQKLNYN
jgi:hypothetical protein